MMYLNFIVGFHTVPSGTVAGTRAYVSYSACVHSSMSWDQDGAFAWHRYHSTSSFKINITLVCYHWYIWHGHISTKLGISNTQHTFGCTEDHGMMMSFVFLYDIIIHHCPVLGPLYGDTTMGTRVVHVKTLSHTYHHPIRCLIGSFAWWCHHAALSSTAHDIDNDLKKPFAQKEHFQLSMPSLLSNKLNKEPGFLRLYKLCILKPANQSLDSLIQTQKHWLNTETCDSGRLCFDAGTTWLCLLNSVLQLN